ncbi:MBL fold metallo-hydrolase [Sphingobacterium sp. WQ 366]|uniref:MBL fold metallo-hydrolase n=2 Tax=Sphingobacterium bovistauri TaxID=2781959 RepID=A0ABS7Z0F5_9SPHI|nr:MBL fold metallo-hydrolase [Sphingobacterium bovistauri]
MLTLVIIIAVILVATLGYMQQAKFGKSPSGTRLERIKKSPNFNDGKFQNLSHTPTLAEGHNWFKVLYETYIKNKPRQYPTHNIPSVKTDILNLPIDSAVLVWFGHSSYFIQIDGKRILVDPVFSGNASPIPGTTKSFRGTDIYTLADLPVIDYLFISHDHYDHMDYDTLIALKDKTKNVICGLGVGSHFEYWGYDNSKIIERDWNEYVALDNGFTAFFEPARHFSGRGLSTNNTLWTSYVLQTPSMKIYIGGDSGYDKHYSDIGKKHNSIDLAILDNGQYNEAWKYIHNLPKDVMKAAQDLNAKRIFPVHSSKFALASHDWDEPLVKLSELNKSFNIPMVTPMIGEIVYLKDNTQIFTQWWLGMN